MLPSFVHVSAYIDIYATVGTIVTSRKYGKKEPQSFLHGGFFDHPDLQSLNNCRFVLWFYNCNFEIMGACNTPPQRYFQDLSSGILKAPQILKI